MLGKELLRSLFQAGPDETARGLVVSDPGLSSREFPLSRGMTAELIPQVLYGEPFGLRNIFAGSHDKPGAVRTLVDQRMLEKIGDLLWNRPRQPWFSDSRIGLGKRLLQDIDWN